MTKTITYAIGDVHGCFDKLVALLSHCDTHSGNPPFGRTDRQRMDAIERGFLHVGIRKVIWLEGDAAEPITNGHADG
jgi:hypothetical protein